MSFLGLKPRLAQEWAFDLKDIQLVPFYAVPKAEAFNIKLAKTSMGREISVAFTSLRHVFKFQHLITGYKPYNSYYQ
jgi:hypothetical protein